MEQALERRVRIIPATKKVTDPRTSQHGKQRVAAYCRVNTNNKEQINSYEAQKAYYTQKIEENPDWELAGIFADKGLSGASMKKRDNFNKMIAACKRGRIDTILTKSLSRFARNTVDCLETVRMLRARGIGVIFEKENINTLTESSEFLITLFSGFAQAEIESLSKNVTWGKEKSRAAGNVPFQYKKLLGYRKGEDEKPEIDPDEAKTVLRIYRRYLDGCSLSQIKQELEADRIPTAQAVQRWSYQVIHNILTNERYIGDAMLGKTFSTGCINGQVKQNTGERLQSYVENNHPAIIPREMFYRVQEEMARRASKRKVMQRHGKTELGKYSAKYALSELLVCGECGTPYKRCTWARNGKKRIVWRCISRLEFGTKYCHSSPTLDEEKLHQAILEALNEFAQADSEVKEDICPSVLLLERGQVFDLNGKQIFTMGGASSHDIQGGILEPDDPLFLLKFHALEARGTPFRVNHRSWWKEELPGPEEYLEARRNLDRAGWEVDYIITHCAPTSIQNELLRKRSKPDELTDFLEEVRQRCRFRYHFFGHYHGDGIIQKRFVMLHKQILRLK